MSSPYNILDWYWKVTDSSPGTQVFSSASGSFVPLADATYTAWLAKDGGNTPTTIPTIAELYRDVFDLFNVRAGRPAYSAMTISSNTTLTNPVASYYEITPTADSLKVIMPQSNKPGALANGQTIRIKNMAAAETRPMPVYANDGSTVIWGPTGLIGGEEVLLTQTDNSTPNGVFAVTSYLSTLGGRLYGNTSISGSSPSMFLSKSPGGICGVYGHTTGVLRWRVEYGDSVAEGGSNAGSNFGITRYSDAGALLSSPLTINRASGAVSLQGTPTNDNAAPGFVGEYLSVSVAQGVAITISGAWQNLGSISLPAGDWDVSFLGYFTNTSGAVTVTEAYISWGATANALDSTPGRFTSGLFGASVPLNGVASLFCGGRLTLASTTTFYANFYSAAGGGGTFKCFGVLSARRRR
jgi:hypothetical protein